MPRLRVRPHPVDLADLGELCADGPSAKIGVGLQPSLVRDADRQRLRDIDDGSREGRTDVDGRLPGIATIAGSAGAGALGGGGALSTTACCCGVNAAYCASAAAICRSSSLHLACRSARTAAACSAAARASAADVSEAPAAAAARSRAE